MPEQIEILLVEPIDEVFRIAEGIKGRCCFHGTFARNDDLFDDAFLQLFHHAIHASEVLLPCWRETSAADRGRGANLRGGLHGQQLICGKPRGVKQAKVLLRAEHRQLRKIEIHHVLRPVTQQNAFYAAKEGDTLQFPGQISLYAAHQPVAERENFLKGEAVKPFRVFFVFFAAGEYGFSAVVHGALQLCAANPHTHADKPAHRADQHVFPIRIFGKEYASVRGIRKAGGVLHGNGFDPTARFQGVHFIIDLPYVTVYCDLMHGAPLGIALF